MTEPERPDSNEPPLDADEEALLDRRAASLAVPPVSDAEPETFVLTFPVGDSRFGVDVTAVREVVHQPPLAVIPGGREPFVGLLAVRGQPVAVADLRPLLGLPPRPSEWPLAVVVIDGPPAPLGLAVDALPRIETIRAADLLPTPPELATVGTIVSAVTRGCTLLAAGALLADPRMAASPLVTSSHPAAAAASTGPRPA